MEEHIIIKMSMFNKLIKNDPITLDEHETNYDVWRKIKTFLESEEGLDKTIDFLLNETLK